MILLFAMVVWLGLFKYEITSIQPEVDNHFRAAKYSIIIDQTRIQHLVPGLPSSQVVYRYYIQYGEKKVMQITDFGSTPENGGMVVTWDYPNRRSSSDLLLSHVNKYYTSFDTIRFSIDESRGVVKNLCHTETRCDSMLFISQPANKEYLLYFNDSLPNLTAHELFYPDVKYLPSKIIRKESRNATKTLEEVICGKQAVDSLLHLYGHEGYERITDEEMDLYKLQYPIEAIENLLPKKN